jgi:transcription elongation factor GreA
MSQIQYMTQEGLDKLKEELTFLKTKGRADMANQIKEAREKGDLSENAEYDAAKEAQGHLEARISLLNDAVANARVLDSKSLANDFVAILSTVEIKNLKTDKTVKYTLVSEHEADLKIGKISVNSPIGKGLLGKVKGEKVEVTTPSGILKFQILSISR